MKPAQNDAPSQALNQDTSQPGDSVLTEQAVQCGSANVTESQADLSGFKQTLFAAFDNQTRKSQRAPRRFASKSRFSLKRRIGGGGLGDVYEAFDRKAGRSVAVKIAKSVASWTQSKDDHFFREYRLTASLQHPGIPAIYAAGRLSNGRRFYAMRLVAGRTLKDLIQEYHGSKELRDDRSATHIATLKLLGHLKDVCNTVHAAHSAGILHLDLKPENIMVEPSGATFVVDWGIARSFTAVNSTTESSEVISITEGSSRSIAGTLQYMAPEQIEGRAESFDATTDVFALSGILHMILTGKPSRERNDSANVSRFWSRLRKSPELDAVDSIAIHSTNMPAELVSICKRGLALNRNDRYQCAVEFRAEVERWERGEFVFAHKESYGYSDHLFRWARRHWMISVMSVLFVVAIAFAVGMFGYRTKAEQQEELRNVSSALAFNSLRSQAASLRDSDLLIEPRLAQYRLNRLKELFEQYQAWGNDDEQMADVSTADLNSMVLQLQDLAEFFNENVSERAVVTGHSELTNALRLLELATHICEHLVNRENAEDSDFLRLASAYQLEASYLTASPAAALYKVELAIQKVSVISEKNLEKHLELARVLHVHSGILFSQALSEPTTAARNQMLHQATEVAEKALKEISRSTFPDTLLQRALFESALIESRVASILQKRAMVQESALHFEQALSNFRNVDSPAPAPNRSDAVWVRNMSEFARTLNGYGLAMRGNKQSQKAIEIHEEARRVRLQILEACPWLPAAKSELAQSLGNIADTSIDFGDVEKELAARREAIELLKSVSVDYPSDIDIKRFCALHCIRTISALHRMGKDEEALKEAIEAFAFCQDPENAEPTNAGHLLDVVFAHGLVAKAGIDVDVHRQAATQILLDAQVHGTNFRAPANQTRLLNEPSFDWIRTDPRINPLIELVSPHPKPE